ncbi:MAG: AIM24 family protein [bacterium]
MIEIGNETIILDNLHFVAMKGNTEYSIEKFGSLKSSIFGEEGLVVKIHGPTKIYIQTRNLSSFASYFSTK